MNRNKALGVSSKYEFGRCEYVLYGPFASDEEAEEWLHAEEYDFRERELMSKTAAAKLVGRKAVNEMFKK